MSIAETAAALWEEIQRDPQSGAQRLPEVAQLARESQEPAEVTFGTSGWRGIIGASHTHRNIRLVTRAIIAMFRREDPQVLAALGATDYADFQRRGVVVSHDNRFLGPEFAQEVLGLLAEAGIRCCYAGEATTPEISAAVVQLHAAASINLTPSHNPSPYAGYKFNPSDGGPAGPELTRVIERLANALMANPDGADAPAPQAKGVTSVDPTALYLDFVAARQSLDLAGVRRFVAEEDVLVVVDHVHGASRGRIERLLGASPKVKCLRTDDDKLFGGVQPEPSTENLARVREILAASKARYRLGAIIDPDGDRIRFCDPEGDIDMNRFGALAVHYQAIHRRRLGPVVKSVATSNFANAIAKARGLELQETAVGFKNFRPWMLPGAPSRAIVSFEESDGISGYCHTLEKDAFYGLLLALEMMIATGQNLSAYLHDLREEYGYFYPERGGIEVDPSLAGEPLVNKLKTIRERLRRGATVDFGGGLSKVIEEVITVDGTKVVFDDASWLMIRPSGTEPKVRFYIETRSPAEKDALFAKARQLTEEALA